MIFRPHLINFVIRRGPRLMVSGEGLLRISARKLQNVQRNRGENIPRKIPATERPVNETLGSCNVQWERKLSQNSRDVLLVCGVIAPNDPDKLYEALVTATEKASCWRTWRRVGENKQQHFISKRVYNQPFLATILLEQSICIYLVCYAKKNSILVKTFVFFISLHTYKNCRG